MIVITTVFDAFGKYNVYLFEQARKAFREGI